MMVHMLFTPRYSPAFIIAMLGCVALVQVMGWWAYLIVFVAGGVIGALETNFESRERPF